jgi:prephenate dehydrogenase
VKGTVGVLGVGLIGGSIGLSARRAGAHVIGADCDPSALEAALARGAIDAAIETEELYRQADVVAIATHLESTLDELKRLACKRLTLQSTLVLDVSSVKSPVVAAAAGLKNFVATHPMAGSERNGILAARAGLFDDAPWAYVPTGDASLDERACKFIRSCGGIPFPVSAAEHDRAVALTSHVPAIVASRYKALLRGSEPDARRLCGPVARELLRVADMNPAMWSAILRANAHNVAPHLRQLAHDLESAADRISADGAERYPEVALKRRS